MKLKGKRTPDGYERSRPSRARGLKQSRAQMDFALIDVAPLAGAWIETPEIETNYRHRTVAPLAGAWIET